MKSKQIQKFKDTDIGKIPLEWEVKNIDELYEIRSGLSKPRHEFGFGYPFLTFKEIFENFSLPVKLTHLANSTENERKNGSIDRGDVFLTRTSETSKELGMSCVALNHYPDATFNGFAKRLRPKFKDKILPEFAMYLFRSSRVQIQFLKYNSLTTRASLNATGIKETIITVPPIEEQRKISEILHSLDKKIKNQKIQNDILKQTIHTIFKSWFIDFDGQTEFIDSELGRIPKNWTVKKIEDVCDTFGGGTPSTKNSDFWHGEINWFTPSDLTKSKKLFLNKSERKITDEGLKNCSSKLHPENSILMTSRATIGYLGINKTPVATNQGFIIIEPKNKNELYYLFNDFRTRVKEFINKANGTVFLEISRGVFRKLSVLLPPNNILNSFHKFVEPIYNMIYSNEIEIQKLKIFRDNLLPKLMSGELRV